MKRIQSKITLAYVAVTFVVVTAVGVLSSAKMESYFRARLVSELNTYADLLVSLLREELAGSLEVADRRIKELSRTTNLRLTLIDTAGVVLVDSDIPLQQIPRLENHLYRPEVQEAMKRGSGSDTRHSVTVGKDFLYFAKQVDAVSSRGVLAHVRFIRLSEHLEDVQKVVTEIRWGIFSAGIIVLLLVVVVSAFVSRRVASPMAEIVKSIKQIQAGNLDTHIPVRSSDEVGQVARAVNEMVERLKTDIAQLKKLERVRSEFLGNVSHELRTPIFSLQGFLETLMNGAVDDPKVNRSFLQKAHDHASRLSVLLGDLITISQIESGEMMLSFRYFRVREFLNSIVNDFRDVAERNDVKVSLDVRLSGEVDVYGDKERLSVALANLVENAIKYNKPNGGVVVSCEQVNGHVRIRVADTGLGIETEHLSRIFERFYRVDKNRSRDVGGTGLGLAIVKHIIEAHGSTVSVESEVGKGSVFSFSLKT